MSRPDLSLVDVSELRSRMGDVLNDVEQLAKEIGELAKRWGDLRVEAQYIYEELVRRGLPLKLDGDQTG